MTHARIATPIDSDADPDEPDAAIQVLHWPGGLRVKLSPWGAAWLSCRVPMPDGDWREALLQPRHARIGPAQPRSFMGSTLGRYANRIAHGRLARGDQRVSLARGDGERHHLHGGPDGWDTRRWAQPAVAAADDALEAVYTLTSVAGDQGYPGTAQAQVRYRLIDAQTLEIDYEVRVDAPSPIGLSNHAYFNLDARQAGDAGDVRDHHLQIHADRVLPVDQDCIPLEGPVPVADLPGFDFRRATRLRTQLDGHLDASEQLRAQRGHDHAYVLESTEEAAAGDSPDRLREAAVLSAADGRLQMTLSTTLPALQLYTGQLLAGSPAPGGRTHRAHAGLALEPQYLPDSPNRRWAAAGTPGDCWLLPGQVWRQRIRYRFTTAG